MKKAFDDIGLMEYGSYEKGFLKDRIETDEHTQLLKDRYRIIDDMKDMVVNMWKVILNKNIKKDHLKLFRDYQNYLGEGFQNGYLHRDLLSQRLEEAVEKLKDQFFDQI